MRYVHSCLRFTLTVGHCDSGFTLGDNTTAFYNFGIIVDPLSEAAQKWSSLMQVSNTIVNGHLRESHVGHDVSGYLRSLE